MEKINAREWVAAICDTVEDMLSEYDIKIPDEERNGEENEACLYLSLIHISEPTRH